MRQYVELALKEDKVDCAALIHCASLSLATALLTGEWKDCKEVGGSV